jgi:hypothetical protein
VGRITISSIPKSRVTVDGRFIRESPLYEYELESGAHVVVLETADGQRRSFKIDVLPGQTLRKTWSFEDNAYVGD